jgi:dTDP-4-amino-4,6-dideoxygalactose transaminase
LSKPLSYGRQSVDEADIEAVARVLRSDWLTQGPLVEAFEQAITEKTGAAHAVACNSGTAALHLAAMAAVLGPGISAVVPAVTFLATANVVRMTGAEVIFADVDPDTGRMTAETLTAALDKQSSVRAVMPVHLGGAASSMQEIAAIAKRHDAVVIEDACHAFGGGYDRDGKSVPVGACCDSEMACFSFHPVKPVTTGEGGAVTTNDEKLARHMQRMRSHGIVRDAQLFQSKDLVIDASSEPNSWYY